MSSFVSIVWFAASSPIRSILSSVVFLALSPTALNRARLPERSARRRMEAHEDLHSASRSAPGVKPSELREAGEHVGPFIPARWDVVP